MQDRDIAARLTAVEEGLAEVQATLEELTERQRETIEFVQGHFEGLADTIRDAEGKIRQATDDAALRLVEEPAYPSALRDAVERIEETVEAISNALSAAGEGTSGASEAEDEDALYERVRVDVLEQGKASTSALQRRFKVGYGKAARLMERLEEEGVIEAADGTNRPRRVRSAGGTPQDLA